MSRNRNIRYILRRREFLGEFDNWLEEAEDELADGGHNNFDNVYPLLCELEEWGTERWRHYTLKQYRTIQYRRAIWISRMLEARYRPHLNRMHRQLERGDR